MLKAIGGFLLGCLVFAAFGAVLATFLLGAEWLSDKLTNVFLPGCAWALLACVVVFLPCSIFNLTRPLAAFGFMISSFFFGLTAWLMGFSATLALWGAGAVVFGLFFMGIGVVPMGIVALVLKGFWPPAILIVVGLVLTYGTRAFAIWLETIVERHSYSNVPQLR